MIDLTRDGEVFVLRMDDDENRLSPTNLDQLETHLGEVERTDGPRALVTTGTGKFFSNGLDLDWVNAHPDEFVPYLKRVDALFARFLTLPCITVAACNGHTFAAGAMVSLCHDHRILRADRGYWCLPEVDLGMPFPPGMNALISGLLPARTAHEAMVTGRRYAGPDALAAGIVNAVAAEGDVLPSAIAHAASQASKAGANLQGIRTKLHAGVLAALSG